jgi:hypothetical protein
MNLKIHLFDVQWTDNADYEHIMEERLYTIMEPFFEFKNVEYTKEYNWEEPYSAKANIFAEFSSPKDLFKFKLKYADRINELR